MSIEVGMFRIRTNKQHLLFIGTGGLNLADLLRLKKRCCERHETSQAPCLLRYSYTRQ